MLYCHYLPWHLSIPPAPEMQGRIYHISFVAEEAENQRSVSQAYARKEVASRGVNVVYLTSKPK